MLDVLRRFKRPFICLLSLASLMLDSDDDLSSNCLRRCAGGMYFSVLIILPFLSTILPSVFSF